MSESGGPRANRCLPRLDADNRIRTLASSTDLDIVGGTEARVVDPRG